MAARKAAHPVEVVEAAPGPELSFADFIELE
jgi:hypothetical protein